MKKYFLFFVFIFYNSMSLANTSIVYLDMDKVVSKSEVGKSILTKLDEITKKKIKTLEKIANELKEKEKKLLIQKNLLSISEYEKKIILLRSEVDTYNLKKKNELNKLNQLKENSISKFLKEINTIVLKYTEEKNIILILQKKNIVIGKANLDVSDDIIKLINQNVKEFKVE
jgi:outer membrane protein